MLAGAASLAQSSTFILPINFRQLFGQFKLTFVDDVDFLSRGALLINGLTSNEFKGFEIICKTSNSLAGLLLKAWDALQKFYQPSHLFLLYFSKTFLVHIF